MSYLFESFKGWKAYCESQNVGLVRSVIEYEVDQKNSSEEKIWAGLQNAYTVMKEAVKTGLEDEMTSRSGMINNGAKKVYNHPLTVLSPEFQKLISRALAAKEVNSCMGRVVAAPTAGASGILPGTLVTLQEIHGLTDARILEGLLVGAGIALIIEEKASLAGAVGGCQAETGSAAAMAAGGVAAGAAVWRPAAAPGRWPDARDPTGPRHARICSAEEVIAAHFETGRQPRSG